MVQPLLPNGRPTLPPVALAPPAPRPYGRRVERIALVETARSPLPRAWFLPYYDPRAGVTPALRASFKLMMRHPVVKAAALTKVWSVASLDWDVKPADPTNRADQDCKDFTKHCIDRLDGGMPKLVETILLPMLIDGYQAAEKVRDVEQSEPRWRGKVVYAAVKSKPTELYDLVVDAYANVTGVEGCGPNRGAEWPIEDFVFTRYLPLYGNPAGTSDFAAAYSHYWMADTVTKLRARHAEKFVDPMLWATSSADDKEETKQALRDAQGKTWMVVPAEAKVEAITLSQGGEVAYKSFLDDTDKKILIAITGAYLQALESQVQDPRGSASVSKSISELFQWVLLSIVLETVSKQMFGELTRLNFAGVRPPRLVMGGVTEEEAAKIIANLTGLQTLGYDLSKSDVARRTGYQPADPADAADKLVRPQAAANMPPGTAGPGPFGFADRAPVVAPADPFPAAVAFAGFDPADHPRDDHGRFVSAGAIAAAKGDPAKAAQLRSQVTDPKERAKLDQQLGPETAPKQTAPAEGPKPDQGAVTFTRKEDRAAAERYAKDTHGQWGDKLPPEQKAALKSYADESSYKAINTGLRSGQVPAAHAETVRHLDAAIAAAPPTEKELTVYRGVGPGLAAKLQPGAEFADHGFVSTSLNRHVAEGFADDAMIQVKVPPGTKMAAMDASGQAKFTGAKSENEWVLPRGTKFKVTGRTKDPGGFDVIHVEVVPHG